MMKLEINRLITYLPVITACLYCIGSAQNEGFVTHFGLSTTAYQLDLTSGLLQGFLSVFTLSILPLLCAVASAFIVVFIAEATTVLISPSTLSSIRNIFKKLPKFNNVETTKSSHLTIFQNVIIGFLIFMGIVMILGLSLKSGEQEAVAFEKKATNSATLVDVIYDGGSVTGQQIQCSSTFCAFYENGKAVSISTNAIKTVRPHS